MSPDKRAVFEIYRFPQKAISRRRRAETVVSFLIALLMMAGIIFSTTLLRAYDLSHFQKIVSSFFQISLKPQTPSQTQYSAAGAALEQKGILSARFKSIFLIPPISILGQPDSHQSSPASMPAIPHKKLPDLKRTEKISALRKLEQENISLTSLPLFFLRSGRKNIAITSPKLPARTEVPRDRNNEIVKPAAASSASLFTSPPEAEPPQAHETPPRSIAKIRKDTEELLYRRNFIEPRPVEGYPTLDNDITASFAVHHDPETGENFFRLSLEVRDDSELNSMPKDMLFLVDTSQSIPTKELTVARQAVLKSLAQLPENDRWNIAIFSNQTRFFAEDFQPAADFAVMKTGVEEFIQRKRRERQTNLFDATQKILHDLPKSNRPCNVFLISDGRATRGQADIKHIVQDFRRIKRDNFSIFTFNIGPGGNRHLLSLLAYRSRGNHLDAEKLAAAEQDFLDFTARFNQPVLANVVVQYTDLAPDDINPEVLPNLYRNQPLVIYGKAPKDRAATIRVAGMCADGPREFFFHAEFPEKAITNREISHDWARGKTLAMIAQLAENPKDTVLREKILALSRRYGLDDTTQLLTTRGFLAPIMDLFFRPEKTPSGE